MSVKMKISESWIRLFTEIPQDGAGGEIGDGDHGVAPRDLVPQELCDATEDFNEAESSAFLKSW